MNPIIKYAFFDSEIDNKNCVRFKVKSLITHLLKYDAYQPWMEYLIFGKPKKITEPGDMFFMPWMLETPEDITAEEQRLMDSCEQRLSYRPGEVDLDREWIKSVRHKN